METFVWPWQYSFPPFFTLQHNVNTKQKQLEAWCALVLSYHRHLKLYFMDVAEAEIGVLFNNKAIDRKLSSDFIYLILEELRKNGNIEWIDKNKKQCLVLWRTPEEWGNLIYKWASSTGHINSICTLYEITNGEYTTDQEFYGLEKQILIRSLKELELQKKAELMMFDKNEGVKFL